MQLSKQQFSSLSKAEKQRLLKVSSTARQARPAASRQRGRNRNGGSRNGSGSNQSSFGLSPKMGRQQAAASAYSTGLSTRAPIITMTRDQCRIRHRELISSVTGSVAFTVANSFACNPGLAASFPWLSVMAQAWEQYEFTDLKYCYYTRTGTNVPGSLMMAFDYDAADAAPASEQIASSYEGVVEDAPWKDITCFVRKLSMVGSAKKHYTRSGPLAANLDIKSYDVGTLHLITLDGTAVPWGKLWVEYDVVFTLPQLPPTGGAPFGGSVVGATTQTGANPFGTAPIVDAQSQGITMDAGSTITFSTAGTYVLGLTYVGTAITAVAAPTAGAGVTVISSGSTINGAATGAQMVVFATVTNPATATLDFALTATTITAAQMGVGQAPGSSLN